MQFLENLYSNQYFAPVLFTIVAILTVLFIIVLILALKDAKKNKNVVEVANNNDEDTFVQIDESQADLSIPIDKIKINNNHQEEKQEIVDSIVPETETFEEVKVEAPKELVENVETVQDYNDIKIEESEVASIDDVKQAESELDIIAQTLLKEYQKEHVEEEKIQTPQINEEKINSEQISSVFVSPKVSEETHADVMPNFSDIPEPQPIKVVSSSDIIDSSKNNDLNNIEVEEYTIKK